jgi:endonuclease YncB( thermonuclease family)
MKRHPISLFLVLCLLVATAIPPVAAATRAVTVATPQQNETAATATPLVTPHPGLTDIRAVVAKVRDGDTLTVTVPGWHPAVATIGVRLAGIDTPELRDARPQIQALAELAREWTRSRCPVGATVILRDAYLGSLSRLSARVVTEDGVDLGQELVRRGLAKPWNGRGDAPW